MVEELSLVARRRDLPDVLGIAAEAIALVMCARYARECLSKIQLELIPPEDEWAIILEAYEMEDRGGIHTPTQPHEEGPNHLPTPRVHRSGQPYPTPLRL
jgi:hypothetical protein